MRRVVVTGIGPITPVGLGWRASWAALIAGRSGIAPVRSFDTFQLPAHIGAEVKDFSPEPYVRRQPAAALGRSSQFAVAAARMAIEGSGLNLGKLDQRRAGVSMGTTSGEPAFVERYNEIRKQHGLEAIPAEILPKYPSNVIPTNVAIELGLRGQPQPIHGDYALINGFSCDGNNAAMVLGG